MTKDEALNIALEALEWSYGGEPMPTKELEAMDAIRQVLAEQKGSEISELRQAAEMALEALEEYTDVVATAHDADNWHQVIDGGKPAREAIQALRQALAEWTPDDTAYRPDGLSQDMEPETEEPLTPEEELKAQQQLETHLDGVYQRNDQAFWAQANLGQDGLPPVKSYCGGKPNYCEPEMDKQCSSCGGFCGEVCEREDVKPNLLNQTCCGCGRSGGYALYCGWCWDKADKENK